MKGVKEGEWEERIYGGSEGGMELCVSEVEIWGGSVKGVKAVKFTSFRTEWNRCSSGE